MALCAATSTRLTAIDFGSKAQGAQALLNGCGFRVDIHQHERLACTSQAGLHAHMQTSSRQSCILCHAFVDSLVLHLVHHRESWLVQSI